MRFTNIDELRVADRIHTVMKSDVCRGPRQRFESRDAGRSVDMDLVRTLARTRRGRLLHPAGRSFDGALEITGTPGRHWGARILDRPAVHRTTVRISKATPTPPGWPDVRGLALHIAADEPFDLLMSPTAAAPALRHVPLPGRSFAARYGSLLSYRSARGRVLLGAVP